MSTIYLDQNALLALGRKARKGTVRDKLDTFLQSESHQFVVSIWHLIETSKGRSLENSIELAQFIDSLRPSWLMERYDILKLDVADDFYRFLNLPPQSTPRVVNRSRMFAALRRRPSDPIFRGTSRELVTYGREHQVKDAYDGSARTVLRLREHQKAGRLTNERKSKAVRLYVKGLMPDSTPAGLQISAEMAAQYLNGLNPTSIPSVALDIAISEHEWAATDGSGADSNSLIDKFHLVSALPCVDEVVSDDKLFHSLYETAKRTGHVRAKLLRNLEFLRHLA